jgi:hypothetical protein
VAFTVRTNQGCQNTIQKVITIGEEPIIGFKWSKVCSGDSTRFMNTSSSTGGTNIVTYSWDFGDGNPIIQGPKDAPISPPTGATSGTYTNPKHKYGTYQVYNVSLTGITNVGCQATFDTTIYILDYAAPSATLGYYEDFSSGSGTWVRGTINNSSWNFGPPDGAIIKTAGSGTVVWWT